MRYYKLVRGFIRLWVWAVCPKCNHDAPELYDCNVCNYYARLPRYRSSQTLTKRKRVWKLFKKDLKVKEGIS